MTTLERPEIRPTGLLTQAWAIARRNFLHIKRMPEMLMDVTIQPVMFVLLFAYVFGSSIDVATPAGYRAFLLAGIMAQTVAFASFIVAVGLTADLEKGIVDRMRSLPINPAAVLVGRSISSLAHSSIGLVVMSLTGLVIGWRIHTNVFEANTFAPTDRMPTFLRFIAEWNPISSLTQAVRELWGNDQPLAEGAAFPMHHPIPFTIGWIILITAVVAPLAIRTFRRRTAD